MSINDLSILERIKCLNLLKDMKINTDEIEIRGHHLLFTYDNDSVVCKIGDDVLFDFLDFDNIDAAKEYFYKQREKVSVKIHKVKRFREEQICLRSIFKKTIF